LGSKLEIDRDSGDAVYEQEFGVDVNEVVKANVARMVNSKLIRKYLEDEAGVDMLEDR
jgi:hypothetical protein